MRFRLISFILFFFLTFSLFGLSPVYAQTAWSGRCVSSSDASVPTIQGLECLFYNVLQVITYVAGLAFFMMFIVGGFKYLFSSNDQKAVAQASSTLTMAVIGLVGIILAWFILKFLSDFTGQNLLNFEIPIFN